MPRSSIVSLIQNDSKSRHPLFKIHGSIAVRSCRARDLPLHWTLYV